MIKHTPGPWKLGSQDKLWITNGKLSIATCEEQDMPEAQANARLIAAAPTTTALLWEAWNVLHGLGASDELLTRIRVALVNATGDTETDL